MKNQPNKATVKDGLPTADALIEENLGGLELTMDDEMWKFYSDVIRQCMQSYSDQQNAELREQLKETENSLDGTTYNLKRVVKKCNGLTERVKELEGLLTIWVKQNNYLRRHSISDFDDIHNQTKNALKK